jgi:hypothetical protein
VILKLQVTNGRENALHLQTSIACHSSDLGRDVDRGGEDPNAMLCGSVTDITLAVPARGTAVHGFAVCFLLPGLYQVYSYDSRLGGGGSMAAAVAPESSHTSLYSVRTCYILVA